MAGRDRRRRRTALLVSLVVHAALLSPLLLVAPRFPTALAPTPAKMRLSLVPEAALGVAKREAPPDRPATNSPARPAPPAEQAPRPPPAPSAMATAPPASAPTATPPASATFPSGAVGAAEPAASAGSRDAIRRALHAALACAPGNVQNLDEEARAICRKRLIEGAAAMGDARVDTIPPEKRAYYDAVVKAYQDPMSTSHPPAIGCALPFGVPKGWKPSHRKPPHSLKLGPLPCYILPPKGFLTEEADIPPADDIPRN